jgi:hypothetical protein
LLFNNQQENLSVDIMIDRQISDGEKIVLYDSSGNQAYDSLLTDTSRIIFHARGIFMNRSLHIECVLGKMSELDTIHFKRIHTHMHDLP